MVGNRHNFFKTRPDSPFKRKGGSMNNKGGKWNNSSREYGSVNSQPTDTVYRILCPSRKIGGVIGKGGGIVKALREETLAKITVADSVPGSDERVIIIYSSPTKISRKQDTDEDLADENEQEKPMEPHCAAQDALLKVHDRIVEEDLFGGVAIDDDNENNLVTARLLVPNNMVGCLLGKRGDVIQRLRTETGASIRVLPAEHLPSCAMDTDELVLISGNPNVAKNALYEVSTLLHQNPRKDKPPLNFPMPRGGPGFYPPVAPMTNMLPPENPMWSHRNSTPHGMPPARWMGEFGSQPSGFRPSGFNGVPPGHGGEAPAEFSIKILCSSAKIGGVIGKGGSNVRQLQQDTGTGIHVEDASTECDERVIHVSAIEALWNRRSQTIDAILELQNKTSEFSEKGLITTRLLVPSSKVGCLLGQGGQVINEMRRRTQADIRVYSKDEKPKCAAEDEELVQISGNFAIAKDALAEIASRLRTRTLRDANAATEPPPAGPAHGFGPTGSLAPRRPPSLGALGAGSSSVYDHFKGGRLDYEHQSYPVPPVATKYPNVNSALDTKIPNNALGPVIGTRGSNISNIDEVGGARMKLEDPQSGGSERVVEIHGSSDHLTTPHGFVASPGQSMNPHQGYHQNMNPHRDSYPDVNAHQASYQNINVNSQRAPYQNINAQHGAYQNINAQHGSYQHEHAQQSSYPEQGYYAQQASYAPQSSYPNANPPPGTYQNISAQQGSYQY